MRFKVSLFVFMLLFSLSSISFAAWSTNDITIGATSSNPKTVKLSNKVTADSQFNAQTYSAATYNTAGRRVFATASGMSKIKYQWCTDMDCNANTPTSPISNGNSGDIASWGSDL